MENKTDLGKIAQEEVDNRPFLRATKHEMKKRHNFFEPFVSPEMMEIERLENIICGLEKKVADFERYLGPMIEEIRLRAIGIIKATELPKGGKCIVSSHSWTSNIGG